MAIEQTKLTGRTPSVDEIKLKEDLMKDLTAAQTTAAQTAQSFRTDVDANFAPKAFRIGNKAYGKLELKASEDAIQKAIDELSFSSGIVDKIELSKFQTDLKQKFNKTRMELLKMAAQSKIAMAKAKYDRKKQDAIGKALGTAAGAFMGGLIGGPIGAITGGSLAGSLNSSMSEVSGNDETLDPSLTTTTDEE